MNRITLQDLTRHGIQDQHVCVPCGTLAGPAVRDDLGGAINIQGCRHLDTWPEDWPDRDLSQTAELCHCCGQILFRGGSRFSLFFCEGCRDRVLAFNAHARRYVIPVGRHSVHAGWSFSEPEGPEGELALMIQVQGWQGAREMMGALHEARRDVIQRVVLSRMEPPFPVRIPIGEYLELCVDTDAERQHRFRRMLLFLQSWSEREGRERGAGPRRERRA